MSKSENQLFKKSVRQEWVCGMSRLADGDVRCQMSSLIKFAKNMKKCLIKIKSSSRQKCFSFLIPRVKVVILCYCAVAYSVSFLYIISFMRDDLLSM